MSALDWIGVAVATVITTIAISPLPAAAVDPAECDRVASPRGSDSRGSGSVKRPFRTPQRLIDSLRPGQTGCFRGGRYRFSLARIATRRITLTSYRGENVTLHGSIKIVPPGSGSTIAGMRLNGKGGESDIGPKIYADNVVIRNNRITNRHSDICILVARFYSRPAPRNVVIAHNRVYGCGELPSTNLDHGIYLSAGVGTVVADNLIYDNADRGIQIYPAPRRTQIVGNVINGNGDGIVITGSEATAPTETAIHGNVISNSRLSWNVRSGPSGRTGRRNVVTGNCVYAGRGYSPFKANGGIERPSRNFTAASNVIAKPGYRKPAAGDLGLHPNSRCLAVYTGTMARP